MPNDFGPCVRRLKEDGSALGHDIAVFLGNLVQDLCNTKVVARVDTFFSLSRYLFILILICASRSPLSHCCGGNLGKQWGVAQQTSTPFA